MATPSGMSSPYTATFSSARRIPTTTFDTILPPAKISTWEQEDAKVKPKRSSKELTAKATTKVGNTMRSAITKAEELKQVVDKKAAESKAKKGAKKAEKETP